jgi:hypothetical protein
MEITERGVDNQGSYATATAWLWVDGRCIYHVQDLGARIKK